MRNRQHSVTLHMDVRIEGLATGEAWREVSKPTYPVGERARDQGPYCVPQVPPEAVGPCRRRGLVEWRACTKHGTVGPARAAAMLGLRQGSDQAPRADDRHEGSEWSQTAARAVEYLPPSPKQRHCELL